MQRSQTTSARQPTARRTGSMERVDHATAMDERLLTADEVARTLHLSRSFLYKLIRRGDLPSLRLRGALRIRSSDVLHFLRTRLPGGEA